MLIRLLLAASLMIPLCLHSQDTWTNYTTLNTIHEVFIDDETFWLGSQGGLTATNIETGENTTYLAGNSPIIGAGITSITKAPDGGMWFGSYNAGLFEFKDGEWTNYFEGIVSESAHEITNMEILPNGDVLFFVDALGSPKNFLYTLSDGNVLFHSNISNEINSFKAMDNDVVYAVQSNAIFKYSLAENEVVHVFNVENSILDLEDDLSHIQQDKNGDLIISSAHRILKLKDDELSVISNSGYYVLKSFTDAQNNVYFTTYLNEPDDIRLIKYDGSDLEIFDSDQFAPLPVERDPIFMGVDHKGRMYAYMYSQYSNDIFYRYENGEWSTFNATLFPMHSNYQSDVKADCEGNIWFSNGSGFDVRYADGSWEQFVVEEEDFRHFRPGSMAYDPLTCDMWFANSSNGGGANIPGIVKVSGGVITEYLYDHDNVYHIVADGKGKMYFYSARSGFGYIENDEVRLIEEFEQYESIYHIDSDSEGNIYLAGWDIGLVKYNGDTFEYLGAGDGSNRVYRVFVDNDDLVWTVSSSGLYRYNGLSWDDFTGVWPSNTVYALVQDVRGNYWVSTWYDGLYYWNEESIQNYNIFNSGLTTNSLRGLYLDLEGNLIVSQHVGVTVLNIPSTTRSYKGKGLVFFDSDQNGEFDASIDVPAPGQKVKNTNRGEWAVSNASGTYRFYSDIVDQYTFIHELDDHSISTTGSAKMALINGVDNVLPEFGFWREPEEDVTLSITNSTPVCNREFRVNIYLRNENYEEVNGDLTITHNGTSEFVDSSIPSDLILDEQIVFEDVSIPPLRSLKITLTMQAPGIEEETTLEFKADYKTMQTDFFDSTTDIVLCSYDPNDKKVEPTGAYLDDFSLIKDPLKYTIRFQNEGTYKAFDITIIDTLDVHVDPSTFELITSSHRVEASITESGIITFFFPDINLPHTDEDELGSQGFVTFTVKPKEDVVNFTTVENTASIYFDFNPPIVTNTTEWNLVDDLSLLSTSELDARIVVSPNPTRGSISVFLQNEAHITIFDLQGRRLKEVSANKGGNAFDLDLSPGVYILSFVDDLGMKSSVKLVVI